MYVSPNTFPPQIDEGLPVLQQAGLIADLVKVIGEYTFDEEWTPLKEAVALADVATLRFQLLPRKNDSNEFSAITTLYFARDLGYADRYQYSICVAEKYKRKDKRMDNKKDKRKGKRKDKRRSIHGDLVNMALITKLNNVEKDEVKRDEVKSNSNQQSEQSEYRLCVEFSLADEDNIEKIRDRCIDLLLEKGVEYCSLFSRLQGFPGSDIAVNKLLLLHAFVYPYSWNPIPRYRAYREYPLRLPPIQEKDEIGKYETLNVLFRFLGIKIWNKYNWTLVSHVEAVEFTKQHNHRYLAN